MRKYARLAIGAFAIAFTVFVALQFKRPTASSSPDPVVRSDPKAIIESTSGTSKRITGSREDVDVTYQKASTYGDGSTTFTGLTITVADRNRAGRTFTVTANQGQAGQDDSMVTLDGNVQMKASDGMIVKTEHAVYRKADGSVNIGRRYIVQNTPCWIVPMRRSMKLTPQYRADFRLCCLRPCGGCQGHQ